ncbi:hypothetical protein Tco_0876045 [Tanacetum coccineum]|uniref:Uncharacterized protein n=1 Tax=Tanacetum coccineum TaxID=301880 RepID=A0ABQ5BW68_9ASTR
MPVSNKTTACHILKWCMFALTVILLHRKQHKGGKWLILHGSKNSRMKLHQFDRAKSIGLVRQTFGKMIIKLKWLWKNNNDEDHTDRFNVSTARMFVDRRSSRKGLPSQKALYGLKASPRAWQKPGQYIWLSGITKMNSGIEDDIMDPVMQCTTLPAFGFSPHKLVSFVTEIHTLSIDISLREWLIMNRCANCSASEY